MDTHASGTGFLGQPHDGYYRLAQGITMMCSQVSARYTSCPDNLTGASRSAVEEGHGLRPGLQYGPIYCDILYQHLIRYHPRAAEMHSLCCPRDIPRDLAANPDGRWRAHRFTSAWLVRERINLPTERPLVAALRPAGTRSAALVACLRP